MSTLVSYLLAVILQFMGVTIQKKQETVSVLTHQQCEVTSDVLPYSFINNNNEQELKTNIKEK